MKSQHNILVGLAFLTAAVLSTTPAYAQIVGATCPTSALVFTPSPTYCNGVSYPWASGVCGCSNRLYNVQCGGPGTTGITVNGVGGCQMVVACIATETNTLCPTR